MRDDPPSEIGATFVVFDAEGMTTSVKVTPRFWAELTDRFGDFSGKMLVLGFHFEQDRPTSECHPHGDEWVCLLSDDFDLVMDLPDGQRAVRLHKPGSFVILPRRVLHTAKVRAPSSALFVTPSQGTLQRPAQPDASLRSTADADTVTTPSALHALRVNQINLVCRDIDASLAFYRALGIKIVEAPHGSDGIRHAKARFPDSFLLEFDYEVLARVYSSAWRHEEGSLSRLQPVRGRYHLADTRGRGSTLRRIHGGRVRGSAMPFRCVLGQRYAIVADPDGHDVGLMSPADAAFRTWPPVASPAS
ncbi:MAG: VOC family protein [Acidiferrobacterales bacterium]